ncbi:MAG: helix-turn-helix domain-containing protein [Muribaculaceae bacterium]|nr:helix-turn-helix domain-containing protein [Muribaculaceae bacterium]
MDSSLHEYIVYSTDTKQINSPAFYDCVVHLLCLGGDGILFYNEQTFPIRKGQIAVLSQPRQVRFIYISDDFSCEYIAAPDKFLHNLLPANNYSIQGCVSLFSNPIIDVSKAEAATFSIDLANIRRRISDTDHLFYAEMIGSLLQTMVYDLFSFHARCNTNVLTTDRVGFITSQFFTLIEAGRPKTQREVAYYAEQLNVTPKYLSDTIKRVTGKSALAHINRAAANIVIEYLKDDRLSITQIADDMHFSSLSYFSRYCQKHIGMSPAQFRTAGVRQ